MTQQATELWTAWTTRRDESAFHDLVRPELPHALGFARRLGCGHADAEDALQDALARLAAVRDDAPAALGVRAWLFREVHVRARSRLRSERRRRTRESAAAVVDTREVGDAAVDLREEVERALADLAAGERAAVELRYLHDLDYREISLVLGASEGACRQRVSKALAVLRQRFGTDAATAIAALPLPAVRDATALVRGALGKASAAPTTAGGAKIMATTTQKLALTALLAAALGVAGTLVVQRVGAPVGAPVGAAGGASGTVAAASDARDAELARRDGEIARLRAELPESPRRRGAIRSSGEASSATGAPATVGTSADAHGAPAGGIVDTGAMTVVVKKPEVGAVDILRRSQPWQAAIRQVADPARRDAAWCEVRAALSGSDELAMLGALETVFATSDVKLDRTGLRELLLPLVDLPDSETRLRAWAALTHNGIEPPDIAKLRDQIRAAPGDRRADLLHRLNWATKGVFDGADADVAVELFADPATRYEMVMALQKARLNDAVVAKVLEFARSTPEAAQHAQFFILATLPDKNRDVVEFLLDRAELGDLAALDRFDESVRRADVAYAGERLRKICGERTAASVRARIIDAIGRVGDVASRDWLTAIRDDATQDARVRESARAALDSIDRSRR